MLHQMIHPEGWMITQFIDKKSFLKEIVHFVPTLAWVKREEGISIEKKFSSDSFTSRLRQMSQVETSKGSRVINGGALSRIQKICLCPHKVLNDW